MHAPTDPAIPPEWNTRPGEPQDDATRWLSLVQRFSFVRAHISIFAAGSVALLVLNLLANPAHVQVDRWIIIWALAVAIHAIIAGMAALVLQLMADDDIRPASEVRWEPGRTWALRAPGEDWPSPPPPAPDEPEPRDDPWHEPEAPPPDEDRVSWQAASDAAWLADTGREPNPESEPTANDTAS